MWIEDLPVRSDWIAGPLVPDIVLFELESPCVFTSRVGLNELLFVKRDEIAEFDYYIAVDCNSRVIEALREGRLSLRGALSFQDGWIVEACGMQVKSFQQVEERHIVNFLPEPKAGLYASFGAVPDTLEQSESFISFRLFGPDFGRDFVNLTAFKGAVDAFYNFVKSSLLPPALINGRDSRFFDVEVAEPKFASLTLAAKRPNFDIAAIQQYRHLIKLDQETLHAQAKSQGEIFWQNLETTVGLIDSSGSISRDYAVGNVAFFEHLSALVPSESNNYEMVEITFNDGSRVYTRSIDRKSGEVIVEAYESSQSEFVSLTGTIVEINGSAKTFIIEDRARNQTTCKIPSSLFDSLDSTGKLRRNASIVITGDYSPRVRRGIIWSEEEPIFF